MENKMAAYLHDLSKLIAIESVLDEKDEQYAFGEGNFRALREIITIAERLGFDAYLDPQGRYAYAEVKGASDQMMGVLGHVDVVPAGDRAKWDQDPFEMTIKDDQVYGRGVLDDKGPTLLSMYALKTLLDEGVDLKHSVRFIFGADEESFWRCMEAYKENEKLPDFGFTPDASFPFIYAEKELVQYELFGHELSDVFLKGGTAFNAVSDRAYLIYNQEVEKWLQDHDVPHFLEDQMLVIQGQSAHAMSPDKGVNAIYLGAKALYETGHRNRMIDFIVEKLGDVFGQDLFGPIADDILGPLTVNLAMVEMNARGQKIALDFRLPTVMNHDKLELSLKKVTHPYQIVPKVYDHLPGVYLELDNPFIQALKEAYEEVTGEDALGITSGGATYARAMDNIIAFGPMFPGEVGSEHQANEHWSIESIERAWKVYYEAFKNVLVRK